MSDLDTMLEDLRKPFHPSQITWKPGAVKGERAIAMAYADLRAYMNRLDEVCGSDWSVAYEPWGEDRIICRLTIGGVTRSSTGEMSAQDEKGGMGGTVAEAQAFKRAASMFGLGRYLYNLPTGWADYNPATKKFTDGAKAKLTAMLVQHYRRATDSKTEMSDLYTEGAQEQPAEEYFVASPEMGALYDQFNALGNELYGDQWGQVRQRNVTRISAGATNDVADLTPQQIQQLITGMMTLKNKRGETNGAAK